jgi:cytochrome P450
MVFEVLLQPGYLAITGVVTLFVWILYQILKPANLPDLPIVGTTNSEWFTLKRAAWRNTWNFKAAEHELYTKYTSKGQAAILPLLTSNVVMLPPSDIKFVADAPTTQLNLHESITEIFQFDYTLTNPDVNRRPVHQHTLVTSLTKEIGNLVPDMLDEASMVFEKVWGVSDQWKQVNVYLTAREIIGYVSNRVFFGAQICRDPNVVELGMSFTLDIPIAGFILRVCAPSIRPFIAPLATLRARYDTWRFRRVVTPAIKRRVEEFDARARDPEAHKRRASVPNDFLEWSVKQAKEAGDPSLYSPHRLADSLLLLNFASIHNSTFALVNAIIDLVCWDKPEVIDELRAEVSSALAGQDGQWNKRSLANMHKLDSLLRESMRLHSALPGGISRVVTAKEGVDTPSGVHLSYGTMAMVPTLSYVRDTTLFGEGADEFKPFRFAEQRADQDATYVERARKAFPTTGTDFLAFGHGRNACPGRFFVASELKLVVGLVFACSSHYCRSLR